MARALREASPCQAILTPRARRVNAHGDHEEERAISQQPGDIEKMSFEAALAALEEIVRKLESGDVPLDDSIALYERAEALRKHCQARLDAAQARIERIVADDNGRAQRTEAFDPGS